MNVLDYIKASNNGHKALTNIGKSEKRSAYSIGDPALAAFLGLSSTSSAGIVVNESSSLGLTAVYRAVSIIAGTIAALPLKSYRTLPDDSRERVKTFLDDPGGPDGLTAYEWKELVMVHLLLHGNTYLYHVYNAAGMLMALQPLHPYTVNVKQDLTAPGGKVFTVSLADGGQRDFTAFDITHITAMSTDGLLGVSPITVARNAIGTGLAGDAAAARHFSNGLLLGGLVSSDESLTKEQAEEIKAGLKAKLSGSQNAGDIAVVNASLKFSPWTMSAEDGQFIESRQFQIEEIARIYGIPKVLLAEDGASTWGSGIAELVRGMQKFTFAPWTSRLEKRLSRLVAKPRFVEFDYAGLLMPNQSEVIANMVAEIGVGTLTIDEARRILNRPPLPPGTAPPAPPPAPTNLTLRQEPMTVSIPAPTVNVITPARTKKLLRDEGGMIIGVEEEDVSDSSS